VARKVLICAATFSPCAILLRSPESFKDTWGGAKPPDFCTLSQTPAGINPAGETKDRGDMKPTSPPNGEAASANITKRIQELGDWRGETLARVRQLIHDADPDIEEEWKWAKASNPGTPVWSHDGIVCTGESYKEVVKLTFARGASIEDPKKLFNSSLEGNTRRAIDLREGQKIDEAAFTQLIRAAVAANSAARAQRAAKKK
jgi:hypothetical protein